MSILPTWPITVGALVLGVVAGAVGMIWWNADEIADRDLKIANMQRDKAVDIANQSQTALKEFQESALIVKQAAESGKTSFTSLSIKLDAIDRRYRNAKPLAPLAVDCKPGAERVRRLTEGAAAVDEAIARPVSGK